MGFIHPPQRRLASGESATRLEEIRHRHRTAWPDGVEDAPVLGFGSINREYGDIPDVDELNGVTAVAGSEYVTTARHSNGPVAQRVARIVRPEDRVRAKDHEAVCEGLGDDALARRLARTVRGVERTLIGRIRERASGRVL